eukprot:TRINITY_DN645_c2_g1_i2.p1 TRINITY_DN645_c2_g1~~TRINITY_DN645_c2_g1_i2.p1  ORF type:complete len:812 (+),score=285.35 TRINITY_DN645_c2_g1_i2:149-2437(+)
MERMRRKGDPSELSSGAPRPIDISVPLPAPSTHTTSAPVERTESTEKDARSDTNSHPHRIHHPRPGGVQNVWKDATAPDGIVAAPLGEVQRAQLKEREETKSGKKEFGRESGRHRYDHERADRTRDFGSYRDRNDGNGDQSHSRWRHSGSSQRGEFVDDEREGRKQVRECVQEDDDSEDEVAAAWRARRAIRTGGDGGGRRRHFDDRRDFGGNDPWGAFGRRDDGGRAAWASGASHPDSTRRTIVLSRSGPDEAHGRRRADYEDDDEDAPIPWRRQKKVRQTEHPKERESTDVSQTRHEIAGRGEEEKEEEEKKSEKEDSSVEQAFEKKANETKAKPVKVEKESHAPTYEKGNVDDGPPYTVCGAAIVFPGMEPRAFSVPPEHIHPDMQLVDEEGRILFFPLWDQGQLLMGPPPPYETLFPMKKEALSPKSDDGKVNPKETKKEAQVETQVEEVEKEEESDPAPMETAERATTSEWQRRHRRDTGRSSEMDVRGSRSGRGRQRYPTFQSRRYREELEQHMGGSDVGEMPSHYHRPPHREGFGEGDEDSGRSSGGGDDDASMRWERRHRQDLGRGHHKSRGGRGGMRIAPPPSEGTFASDGERRRGYDRRDGEFERRGGSRLERNPIDSRSEDSSVTHDETSEGRPDEHAHVSKKSEKEKSEEVDQENPESVKKLDADLEIVKSPPSAGRSSRPLRRREHGREERGRGERGRGERGRGERGRGERGRGERGRGERDAAKPAGRGQKKWVPKARTGSSDTASNA